MNIVLVTKKEMKMSNEIYFDESDFEEIVEWLEMHDEDYVVTEIDLDKV